MTSAKFPHVYVSWSRIPRSPPLYRHISLRSSSSVPSFPDWRAHFRNVDPYFKNERDEIREIFFEIRIRMTYRGDISSILTNCNDGRKRGSRAGILNSADDWFLPLVDDEIQN